MGQHCDKAGERGLEPGERGLEPGNEAAISLAYGLVFVWQARVTQLDRDLKATAQRKEQLDHETLKISQDLVDMVS